MAEIPPRFASARLDSLTPRNDLHPKQGEKIEAIKANPEASYFLYGQNGVGKTHIAWALYAYAVGQNRQVVAYKLDQLLIEYRRFELMRVDDPENRWRPRILSEDLKVVGGGRRLIFLDELEKATPTEFAAKRLFALVDAIMEYGHQLVCTSNMDGPGLQSRWSKEDEVWGNSIARRIADTCTKVDLF